MSNIMLINFIKYRKLWYLISGVLFFISVGALIFWGIKFNIDFTGGTLWRINFTEMPPKEKLLESLKEFELGEINIQPVEGNTVILRLKQINEDTHQLIWNKIKKDFEYAKPLEEKFDSIGPAIGYETRRKAFWATIFSILMICIYVALAFRKVSRPINSFKYGIATLVALFHDVFLTVGAYAIMSHYRGIEAGLPFIAALLTVLGYSVNDTIVVFDRTRENLTKFFYASGTKESFDELVNKSLNQVLARSINTALTTLLPLIAIYIFGGESIKYFAFALIVGIASGAYSSIFIASSILVSFYNRNRMMNKTK